MMEDSHAALAGVCFALRERYNKLRTENRRLLKGRTCVRCRSRLDHCHKVTVGRSTSEGPDRAEAKLELGDICEELERSLDDVQGDAVGRLREIIPRLRQIAHSFPTAPDTKGIAVESSTGGDVLSRVEEHGHGSSVSAGWQGEDRVHGMVTEASSITSCEQKNSEMTRDEGTTSRTVQSKDDINEGDQTEGNSLTADHAPWTQDLTRVEELATSQYTELKTVCVNLQQQNELLKKFLNWKLSDSNGTIGCDDNLMDNGWSLLQPT